MRVRLRGDNDVTHRFPALIAAAHAEGLDGCAAAIRHGVDTIEHGMYLHQRPDLLEAMAAASQVLVPTLSGYYWMAGLEEAVIIVDGDPLTEPRLLSDPGRIWLVLQLGVPVAGQALSPALSSQVPG